MNAIIVFMCIVNWCINETCHIGKADKSPARMDAVKFITIRDALNCQQKPLTLTYIDYVRHRRKGMLHNYGKHFKLYNS